MMPNIPKDDEIVDPTTLKIFAVLFFAVFVMIAIVFIVFNDNIWDEQIDGKFTSVYRKNIQGILSEQDLRINDILVRREAMRVQARDYPVWTPKYSRVR